jgi:hypothetical protein
VQAVQDDLQTYSLHDHAFSDLERKVDALVLEIRDLKEELKERKNPVAEIVDVKKLVHVYTMTTDELNDPVDNDATERSTLYRDEDCQSDRRPAVRKRKRVRRRKRRRINKSVNPEIDSCDDPSDPINSEMCHQYEQCHIYPPGDMECTSRVFEEEDETGCNSNVESTLDTEVLVGDLCQMKNVDAAPVPCGPVPCHAHDESCNTDNHESDEAYEMPSSFNPVDEYVEENLSATQLMEKSEADGISSDVSLHGYAEPLQDRDDGMTVFSCGWNNPILVPWNGRPPDDYHSAIDGFTSNK